MKPVSWTGLLFLTLPLAATAGTTPDQLKPILVFGERMSDSENSGSSIATGIDRSVIEQQPAARSLGDVIDRMPGVFMGGSPNENKDIRLRGLDKEFTRFELNGAQLPGGGEKREFQVNRLSPFAIGEINILRNPTAKYESDEIAGRIQAESREIPEEQTTQARIFGGGQDSLDSEAKGINLFHGQRVNSQFGFNLFADYEERPLSKEKIKETFDSAGVLKETETEIEDEPADIVNLMADLAWFYDQGELHFRPLYSQLDEDKDKEKVKTKLAKDETEIELEQKNKVQTTRGAQLEHVHRFANQVELASGIQYYETLEDKDKTKPEFKIKDGARQLDKTELEDEAKQDDIVQLDAGLTIPFYSVMPQSLETGFSVRERNRFRDKTKIEVKPDGSSKNKGEAKDNYKIQEQYYALYIQDDFLATERLTLTPGVRYERLERTSESGSGEVVEKNFNEVNPHFHVRYQVTDQLTVFGALSRTINMPKFDEVSPFAQEKGDRFTLGNPALDPARSVNTDVGLRWQQGGTELAATVFHKRITDVIEEANTGRVRDGKDVYQVENVGDGRLDGLELELRVADVLPGFTPWGNVTFIHSELTDASGNKRPFNEQPDRIANLGFDYQLVRTGTSLSMAGKYVGDFSKNEVDKEETEASQWFLDVGLRQRLTDQLYFTVDALNILDTEKEKVKFEGDKTEFERETTGPVYLVGLEATF
jgi:outer membrane receptor for ferrienterochelin and colicin